LIFDFGKKIEEAQQKIYDRMLTSRFAKERLLESQKKIDHNIKLQSLLIEEKVSTNPKAFQPRIISSDEPKPEINTTTLQDKSVMSDTTKINKSNELNPLNILKVRLAKGEITKDEYEEMRKMIES
jgi:Short C-terminal domain